MTTETLEEVMQIVESYGPIGTDLNEPFRFEIILREEILRLRAAQSAAGAGAGTEAVAFINVGGDLKWPSETPEQWRNMGWIPLAYARHAPPAVPEGMVMVPRELYLFLMGEGDIKGVHFGEPNWNDKRGPLYTGRVYWWRELLSESMLPAAPAKEGA